LKSIKHKEFVIQIFDDPTFTIESADNRVEYDHVYHDKDSLNYSSSKHGLMLYKNNELIRSAIVCASAGATRVHENSVATMEDNLLICCAHKLYCLKVDDLKLKWVRQVDTATCFAVHQADNGIFTHGELQITRLDRKGNIIWQTGLKDSIVNIENEKDCFILREEYIELQDYNSEVYYLDFKGNFIDVPHT